MEGLDVKRVLLAIPDLHGHRQIYCRELCTYFLSRDLSVTVATDMQGLDRYGELERLRLDPRVSFVRDTWTGEDRPSEQLRRLSEAATAAGADVIFLAEADEAHGLLAAQITRPRRRLPGRRIGLFIRSTNYLHELEHPRAGRVPRAIVTAYSYRPVALAQPRIFHEFVTRRFDVLDAALCLDEVFVARRRAFYGWLPDIATASSETGETSSETAAWEARLSAFLAQQEARPVVVYVGTPQPRRGYELLLRLACEVDGCFVHCGESPDSSGYHASDLPLRVALASRSAILESGGFYQAFETARATLSAARCVVLPYDRRHIGSSGVMLQALMAGRPLLVPDQGLMGWRVRTFGLGLTFTPGDWQDMRHKFTILQNTPADVFADAIDSFLAYFSKDQFYAAMDLALGLPAVAPRIPSADVSGSLPPGAW